jgi:energy-coupling factor transport system permease protein
MAAITRAAHLLSAQKTNPLTWWLAGLSLAVVASLTGNVFVLVGIFVASLVTIKLCRDESPWAQSISFYIKLAAIVVALRVLFRIIFNLGSSTKDALVILPSIDIDFGFGNALKLFGPISQEAFTLALADGLRLAAIILAAGMANSLANPRKLLKSTPGALYEIATAISIAINLAPQLIASLGRVRRARSLRGQSKGIKAITGIVIPVLEDTIDQSMGLAASMSARGFGRKGNRTNFQIIGARLLAFLAICLIVTGSALLLFSPDQQAVQLTVLLVGLVAAGFSVKLSSARATITRYRKEPWRLGDVVILCVSVSLVVLAFGGVFAR